MFPVKLETFASSSSGTSKTLNNTSKEQIYVNINYENHSIKTEPVDIKEEQETANNNDDFAAEVNDIKINIKPEYADISREKAGTVKEEYVSNESNNEMYNVVKIECEWRNSPNQSHTLPSDKEEDMSVSKYKTQASRKQLTANAQSTPSLLDEKTLVEDKIMKVETLKNMTTKKIKSVDPEYTNSTASTSHLVIHDAKTIKMLFICDVCDKAFNQKYNLMRHLQKHPKLYTCTYCSYKTCRKCVFVRHINTKHTKPVYNCSYCSFKTYYEGNLQKHMNTKHTKTKSFNCSYCDFVTCSKSTLKHHINASHTKTTSFNCSYCSYVTFSKSSLKQHTNARHTKSSAYNCSYCSHVTYSRSCLKQHINSKHTKTDVFNCSHCSFKTYSKMTLNQHVNAIHTKSVAYDCIYCNYTSYYRMNLSKHVKQNHS